MSDYEPKCKKTLPIIFDDRMPVNNLLPKIVNRVNNNTEDLINLYSETEALQEDKDELSDAIDDINRALETKADIDGSYPNMTVGNAEQLVATVGVEDKVPYLFRTSGGTADIGDREYDKIVGGDGGVESAC